ncbi:hypothetical protein JAO74_02905 [Sphingomonas sp. BT553]|uniref:Uncharacterized protein n=1 Tax=Sphingomonas mollis TaxID=2795726 RepID=A0ABS0XL27_9SPHN|nr:hypothetical protein [Sphingomonas sp. BT553]
MTDIREDLKTLVLARSNRFAMCSIGIVQSRNGGSVSGASNGGIVETIFISLIHRRMIGGIWKRACLMIITVTAKRMDAGSSTAATQLQLRVEVPERSATDTPRSHRADCCARS